MTSLGDALAGITRLAIDTAPIIYFVEANPRDDVLVTEVFRRHPELFERSNLVGQDADERVLVGDAPLQFLARERITIVQIDGVLRLELREDR